MFEKNDLIFSYCIFFVLRNINFNFDFHVDINECLAPSNPCSENEVCRNTYGNYTCECQSGYIRNGTNCQGYLTLNKVKSIY